MGNVTSGFIGSQYDLLEDIVSQYISKLSIQRLTDMRKRSYIDLPEIINFKNADNIKEVRNYFQNVVSVGQELKVFFKVPNQQITSNITTPATPNPNQVVAVFINFLLLMVEVILKCEEADSTACGVMGSIRNLKTELGFLITFLGDTAMHLQPTNSKNILTDIEAVVNEAGRFFHSFFFAMKFHTLLHKEGEEILANSYDGVHIDDLPKNIEAAFSEIGSYLHSLITFFDSCDDIPSQTIEVEVIKSLVHEVESFVNLFLITSESGTLNLDLSGLFSKFELLNTKIKEHCITVSNMPSDMPPETAVVSLFIVDSILDDLMYLINNKPGMIVAVHDQIVTLHKKLMLLGSSVMEIAEHQEAEHEELVIRTRDVAYEVEFIINSFPHDWYLALRIPQLIEKVQLITMAIKDKKKKTGTAGMLEVAKYPDEKVWLQSKGTHLLEDNVVGFEEMKTEIAEQLVRGQDHLQIISIFGMPGLGKTTLANKLYNDPSVVYHFDKRSWCVISQTYNKRNVLIEILSSMGGSKRETFMKMENDELVENLYKSLKRSRYLVVIDDIWDINVWNDLERYFPDDGTGSRILFTTRNKEVGSKASRHSVINALPFLSEAKCWELLQQKVFLDEKCPQELLDIGKQIAANCHGLPLAVVVIAGVLANMEKKEYMWQKVARKLNSDVSEISNKCISTLELSYEHLPMHLKPCFLYFGTFKEDTEISIRRLISLWVAEGFIKKEEHKSLDDVALEYLMKLIDRSLVLVAKRGSSNAVKTCKIHDLLLEMCWRITEVNSFWKVVKLNDDDPLQSVDKVCMYQKHNYLSIEYGSSHECILPFGLRVRSLLCEGHEEFGVTLFSSSFKVLRVFNIDRRSSGENVLIGTKNLVHVRYLGLPEEMPSMESCHKLEFLDVENYNEVEIPDVLLNMTGLRHMHFRDAAHFNESCRQQATKDESFPINNNLESISGVLIRDEIDWKILKCSPNLRRLKGWVGSTFNHSFDFFNQLKSLKLISSSKRYWSYQSFSLISLPSNLRKITLARLHVSPKQMEIIGGLQYLEVLKLEIAAFEEEQWDTSKGEFPRLKFLELFHVQLAEWNASKDHFSRLQRLVLQSCDNLKMIPLDFGDSLTLQMIEVHGCTKDVEESAKQIQEEQLDNGNEDLKVIISNDRKTFPDY